MMTGLLSDKTGTIDFVCWNEGCNKFDNILKENLTFNISNAKVVLAKESYSKSKHLFQIVFDPNTEITEVKCAPLKAPVTITQISSLVSFQNYSKVNVVGKVIPPPEKLVNTGTDIIKCRIQDNTGTIQLSLLGQEIHNCKFNLNDILLLENVELRIYGILRELQGNTVCRTINPVDRDYSKYLPTLETPNIDLSPPKNLPKEKTINTLNKDDGRQKFRCSVLGTNLTQCLYDKCPKITCRTRVVEMNNGTYKCNNCEVDYLVSSLGIRLILEVTKEDKISKKLLMFNEMAERFIEMTAKGLLEMDEDKLNSHEKYLLSRIYLFTAGPARQPNEYLIESFEVVEDNVSDIKTEKMSPPSTQSALGTSVTQSLQATATEEPSTLSKPYESADETLTLCTSGNCSTLFKPYALDDMPSSSAKHKSTFLFKPYECTTPAKPDINANTQGHIPWSAFQTPDSDEVYPTEASFSITLGDNEMENCMQDVALIDLSTKQDQPPRKKYKFVRTLFN